MKGKLICLIGLAVGGLIGAIISGKQIRDLKQKQKDIDATLDNLRQQEMDLLKELEAYYQKTNEETTKMAELISELRGLELIDPMKIDVQIDPE